MSQKNESPQSLERRRRSLNFTLFATCGNEKAISPAQSLISKKAITHLSQEKRIVADRVVGLAAIHHRRDVVGGAIIKLLLLLQDAKAQIGGHQGFPRVRDRRAVREGERVGLGSPGAFRAKVEFAADVVRVGTEGEGVSVRAAEGAGHGVGGL